MQLLCFEKEVGFDLAPCGEEVQVLRVQVGTKAPIGLQNNNEVIYGDVMHCYLRLYDMLPGRGREGVCLFF